MGGDGISLTLKCLSHSQKTGTPGTLACYNHLTPGRANDCGMLEVQASMYKLDNRDFSEVYSLYIRRE